VGARRLVKINNEASSKNKSFSKMPNDDADSLFAAAVLRESKEEKAPLDLNFSSPLPVRSPWLWVLAFEALNSKEDDFLTSHQTRGKLGDIFRRFCRMNLDSVHLFLFVCMRLSVRCPLFMNENW
jgi:hypothetical protein